MRSLKIGGLLDVIENGWNQPWRRPRSVKPFNTQVLERQLKDQRTRKDGEISTLKRVSFVRLRSWRSKCFLLSL